MYVGTSRPQAIVTPTHWRRVLRVLWSVPLAIVLAPVVAIAALIAYIGVSSLFPAYTATIEVPSLEARVTLRLYSVWDPMKEGGRYLTVQTPADRITVAMQYVDWGRNARTSLYQTPDRRIAVLGPMGDDYLISLNPNPMNLGTPFGIASDEWTYLGAFDFVRDPADHTGRIVRFLSAEESSECLPMRMEVEEFKGYPRYTARQRQCPRR